ncbi:MAG: PaaI family thioesterase [Gammaproteobacteria bacterium]|nr:PaaI family thioesterase [Gammaproteobacteria bacterium]
MKIVPGDYEIPSHYKHWVGDKAEDYMGPFFYYLDEDTPRTAFRIQDHNCNAHDSVHGGILMAFADYTLCIGANMGESESVVTVSCSNEFVAPAYRGDLLEGECRVIRRGKSMVFTRCELKVGEKIILNSSGVIKRIMRK